MTTQLTIKEVMELPAGTKVYRVFNGDIRSMHVLAKHPSIDIFYFISNSDVSNTFSTYIPKDNHAYFTNYNSAKECMWDQLVHSINTVNKVYFDNSKTLN